MRSTSCLVGLLFILLAADSASAGWMATADFGPCPRKYLPNTKGSDGPFASESECTAYVDNVKRTQKLTCATYACVNETGGTAGAAATPAAAGHEMDGHIANALSAGMSGQISGTDALGLASMGILGNALLAPSTPETPQQAAARAENERAWAVQRSKADEEARIKEAAYQMQQDSISMALLDLAAVEFQQAATRPREVSQAFDKGFEHASSCISQNSGAACGGSTSETCIADYRAGYDAGKKKYNFLMEEAFLEGKRAGEKGEALNGASSPNANGPCRIEWIQQYDRGHWAGQHPKAKL
jgi:hypothetical protein